MSKLDWRPEGGAFNARSRANEDRFYYVAWLGPGDEPWWARDWGSGQVIARGPLQDCLDACEASEAKEAKPGDPRCGSCGGARYVSGEPTISHGGIATCREVDAVPCPICGPPDAPEP